MATRTVRRSPPYPTASTSRWPTAPTGCDSPDPTRDPNEGAGSTREWARPLRRPWPTNGSALRTGTRSSMRTPETPRIGVSPDRRTWSWSSCRTRRAPCDRFGTAASFFVWSSLTRGGRVTAWDRAPDAAWLPMPCGESCASCRDGDHDSRGPTVYLQLSAARPRRSRRLGLGQRARLGQSRVAPTTPLRPHDEEPSWPRSVRSTTCVIPPRVDPELGSAAESQQPRPSGMSHGSLPHRRQMSIPRSSTSTPYFDSWISP